MKFQRRAERIRECTEIVLNLEAYSANQIFGSTDELKLKSSMTLFKAAQQSDKIFEHVLEKYFEGYEDNRTVFKFRISNYGCRYHFY